MVANISRPALLHKSESTNIHKKIDEHEVAKLFDNYMVRDQNNGGLS